MARVRPFAAIRYARPGHDITSLTAPPYDVVGDALRSQLLACDPHNVVALELPAGPLDPMAEGNRYATGASTWNAWLRDGTLRSDPEPNVYILEQRFLYQGVSHRRRAFVVEVGFEALDAGVILPHERTLPAALGDRFELIRATRANLSQILSLYDDPGRDTDELFDIVTRGEPIATALDADGVESVVWSTSDAETARRLTQLLADSPLYIADGHHRYATALAYRDLRHEQAAEENDGRAHRPYDYVMMALVNMADPDLIVMPTHRVADAPGRFDPHAFYAGLTRHFVVEDPHPAGQDWSLDGLPQPAFLVKTRADEHPRLVSLRDSVDLTSAIESPHSDAWKNLDVAILQELVLAPLLGIHPDRPDTLARLGFVKDAREALESSRDHDAVFLLRATRMDQLAAVAVAGETMPQKSTYFYPKLLSGLLFRSAE